MAWRFGRGWTGDELSRALAALAEARPSFTETGLEQMTAEAGWIAERSVSVLDCEAPGAPAPGAFARARRALARYEFSDPAIVCAYFDPHAPLFGRPMLLELKVLGLRFLCGVRVTEVIDDADERCSRFGFCYATLPGHIERGAEWFVVTKDHATGEVGMRIESRWKGGDFPTWWSRVGFSILGDRYRQLWLQRAHQRMRALIRGGVEPARVGPVLDASGVPTPALPALTDRARSPVAPVAIAAGLGALGGVRSTVPLALIAVRSAAAGPRPGASRWQNAIASPSAPAITGALAAGELLADKLPAMGARIATPALLARLGAGAIAGATLARQWRRSAVLPTVAGAVAAGVTARGSYRARQRMARRVGGFWAGVLEDALVLGAGALLTRAMRRHAPPALQPADERRR